MLADELRGLGAQSVQTTHGGVGFLGDDELGYRANLELRTASRVLRQLIERDYANEEDVYQLAYAVDWLAWFDCQQTLKVETVGIHAPLKSLDFITLRVKDAICDHFRQAVGMRPSVDTQAPDVRVHVFLTDKRATLYLDTSGEALFKRGWRLDKVQAPLRENLAAGLLALSGWTPDQPLIDPFCGSGTIAIEAAHITQRIAPGIARPFGFERLKNFDRGLWRDLKTGAEQRRLPNSSVPILASDISGRACGISSQNAKRAGVDIRVTMSDARALQPLTHEPGVILGNPPYGERVDLKEADHVFFAEFGSTLKKNFAGWRVALISDDMTLPRKMRLQPTRKIPVFNGAIECRLFLFDMVAGSNRKQ